jgi:hypothetical protein
MKLQFYKIGLHMRMKIYKMTNMRLKAKEDLGTLSLLHRPVPPLRALNHQLRPRLYRLTPREIPMVLFGCRVHLNRPHRDFLQELNPMPRP